MNRKRFARGVDLRQSLGEQKVKYQGRNEHAQVRDKPQAPNMQQVASAPFPFLSEHVQSSQQQERLALSAGGNKTGTLEKRASPSSMINSTI